MLTTPHRRKRRISAPMHTPYSDALCYALCHALPLRPAVDTRPSRLWLV